MAKINLSVSLDFEVETGGVVKDGITATDFIQQSLIEVVAHYYDLTKDPTYLGPKVSVSVPENAVKVVAE